MTRCILAIAVLIGLVPANAEACGRCGFSQCRLVAPYRTVYVPKVVEKFVPTTIDNRFIVNYSLTFPPPSISGSTTFDYTQSPYFGVLNPDEAIRLKMNYATRTAELSQYASEQATLIVQQAAGLEEQRLRLAVASKIDSITQSLTTGGSATLRFDARRGPNGKVELDPYPLPGAARGVQGIVGARCVSCHGPGKQEAGLRLDDLGSVDSRYEALILDRITTNDPARRMPKGGTLTPGEILEFYRTSSFCGGKRSESPPPGPKP